MEQSEAENIALCSAAQEAIWIKRLLIDLGVKVEKAVKILEDNQGAIAIAKNPVNHSRTKHFNIKYHFVRDSVHNNIITLDYCASEDMVADILTKPLSRASKASC